MSAQLNGMRAYMANRPAAAGAAAAGAAGGPQILVVGSGKGGTGTSVVAALVAIAAAAAGKRVLLVDADPHVGPQRYLLGLGDTPALADLRAGVELDAVVVPVSTTLSVIAGGPGLSGAPALEASEHRALLRRVATAFAQHDLVVFDGGSRLDAVSACCESASGTSLPTRLLAVSDSDPIALAATYALIKTVRERTAAFPGGAVAADVVMNRQDEDGGGLGFGQIAQACADFLGATVRHAGTVPDDGSLALALRAGMPIQDAAAGSPAAVAVQQIVETLLADLAGGRGRNDRGNVAAGAAARRTLGGTYGPSFRSSAAPSGVLR